MVKHKKETAPKSKSTGAAKTTEEKSAPKVDKRSIARRTTAPGKARSQ